MPSASPALINPSIGSATTEATGFGGLSRLNFFDGLFLRASHLSTEQAYHRTLAHLVARAGGPGIVDGFELSRVGADVRISAGLAFDGAGRPLFTTDALTLTPADLATAYRTRPGGIDISGEFAPCEDGPEGYPEGATIVDGVYVVCLGASEKLCGVEEVMGALCERACVEASERPYRVEGARAWLTKIDLDLARSSAIELGPHHLRSRAASAYFARSRGRPGALISGPGLRSELWCRGSGFEAEDCVALGLLSIRGGALHFVDGWSARRERVQTPPERYWAHRFAMRPFALFLAEVLQFQCQLSEILVGRGEDGVFEPTDPCHDERQALEEAARWFAKARDGIRKLMDAGGAEVTAMLGDFTTIDQLGRRLEGFGGDKAITGRRILVEQGIVELPSAGYLPIDTESAQTVNEQVRRWMGEGVDLRFCRARPDYVAHAVEEAQHLDRISLLRGLDDPTNLEEVDVIVPDGIEEARGGEADGATYEVRASLSRGLQTKLSEAASVDAVRARARQLLSSRGGARSSRAGSTRRFAYAGTTAFADKEAVEPPGEVEVGAKLFDRTEMRLEELDDAEVRTAYTARSLSDARAKHPGVPNTRVARYDTARKVLVEANQRLAEGRVERPAGAVWADLQSSTDPTTVAAGDVARVSGRLSIVQPGAKWQVLDVDGSAELLLDAVSRSTNAVVFEGSMRALGEVRQLSADGDDTDPFSQELAVRGAYDRARRRLEVTASYATEDTDVTLRLLAKRDGDRTTLRLIATTRRQGRSVTGFSLDLHIDERARALDPGQPLRALASQAIDVIEQSLADPAMGRAARAYLFGRPAPALRELVFRPKHDWVMFHRRRDKDCGAREVAPPPTRPDRTYAVFHLDEAGARRMVEAAGLPFPEGGMPAIAKLLAEDRVSPELFATVADRIAIAAYRDASADLTTNPAALAVDFAASGPGDEIVTTMIGSRGQADGESLELQRAQELTFALQSVSTPATDLASLWTPQVPLVFTRPDADGYAVVLTRPRPKAYCHEVFVSELQDGLPYGDAGFLKAHLQSDLVTRVAEAELVQGTDQLLTTPEELAEAYRVAAADAGAEVSVVRVLSRSAAVDSVPPAEAVLDAMLGRRNWELDTHVVGADLPSGCDVVLIVEVRRPRAREVCQEVYLTVRPDLSRDEVADLDRLRALLQAADRTLRLSEVRFEEGTDNLRSDPGAIPARLAEMGFGVDAMPRAFAIAKDDVDLARTQGRAVLDAIGGANVELSAARVGPGLPTGCDSILLLVVARG